jgi:multiple sugar transport system substrate-binding protein
MRGRGIVGGGLALWLSVGLSCTAERGAVSPASPTAGSPEPVTITLWTYWTGREKANYDRYLNGFKEQYPWVSIKHVGGITDQTKVLAAVTAGDPPDVWQWWDSLYAGPYCQNEALLDLTPYIQRDSVDLTQFSPYWIEYLKVAGKQCALPTLADAWGLYYNKDLFAKAGIEEPPRTLSELTTATKKLTVFNADGTIKVAGFLPVFDTFYDQSLTSFAVVAGADWLTGDGKSALASDPDWANLFRWQRELVEFYGGWDNLQKFVAGLGNNYSPNHAGEVGQIAMWMDGEWRVAFIAADHPELDYGTAPFPVADNHPELYGAGAIATNTVQIPRGAQHPEEAWLLVKYLSSDRGFLVGLGSDIKNIPSVQEAINDPVLQSNEQFKTFLDVYLNPGSSTVPLSAVQGSADVLTSQLNQNWAKGEVSDLESALQTTAEEIDQQLAQGAQAG